MGLKKVSLGSFFFITGFENDQEIRAKPLQVGLLGGELLAQLALRTLLLFVLFNLDGGRRLLNDLLLLNSLLLGPLLVFRERFSNFFLNAVFKRAGFTLLLLLLRLRLVLILL